jgi:hypothetical protein
MLSGRIESRIFAVLLGTGDNLTQADIDVPYGVDITSGVGSNQADLVFSDKRTLLASASENLDFIGVLSDPLGTLLSMAKIKAVLIIADPLNTNSIIIGNGVNPNLLGFGAAAHTWTIPPGGVFAVANPLVGWPLLTGASDSIKVANGGAGSSVSYTVVVMGTSS